MVCPPDTIKGEQKAGVILNMASSLLKPLMATPTPAQLELLPPVHPILVVGVPAVL